MYGSRMHPKSKLGEKRDRNIYWKEETFFEFLDIFKLFKPHKQGLGLVLLATISNKQ